MKKFLTLLLAGLLCTPAFAAMDTPTVAKKALVYSVSIHTSKEYKRSITLHHKKKHWWSKKKKDQEMIVPLKDEFVCGGTYIDHDLILTAGHCFQNSPDHVLVRTLNEQEEVKATLVKLDTAHDLALLYVRGHHAYAKIGPQPQTGEDVINIGMPYDLPFMVSHGIVSHVGLYGFEPFASHYTGTDASCNPGNSGGGMFNSHAELVGVNTMSQGFFGFGGITYAVSQSDILLFLHH
jgi:S1-C subfamily serine protease